MKIVRYTLFILACIAGYILWGSVYLGNIFPSFEELIKEGLPGLPAVGSMRNYTGVDSLEMMLDLTFLLCWPLTCGKPLAMTLHSVALLGAAISSWLLIALEACRTQPLVKALPRLMTFGISLLCGAGMMIPFYLPWTLPSSSTQVNNSSCKNDDTSDQNRKMKRNATPRNPYFPGGLGGSTVLGYILPAATMYLPAPSLVSYEFKRLAIYGFFLSWPCCTAALVWVVSLFRQYHKQGIVKRLDDVISHPRSICAIAFGFSAVPVSVISLYSLATSLGLFSPRYPEDGDIGWGIFVPLPPWSKPASVSMAALAFAQWDHILVCVATFIWGVALYIRACQQEKQAINYTRFVLKILALATFAGLPATAAVLIWERHKILESSSHSESKDE